MNKLIVVFFSSLFLVGSCKKEVDFVDCDPQIMCTEVFVSVVINAKFETLGREDIEKSETFIIDSGLKIFSKNYQDIFASEPFEGIIVVTDGALDKISKNGTEVKVVVYNKSGGVIKEEFFTVGHDCCHVEKLEGRDTIIF